ncbi:MAG: hypothetical protein ACREYA_01555 [Cupriavidus necator]
MASIAALAAVIATVSPESIAYTNNQIRTNTGEIPIKYGVAIYLRNKTVESCPVNALRTCQGQENWVTA